MGEEKLMWYNFALVRLEILSPILINELRKYSIYKSVVRGLPS